MCSKLHLELIPKESEQILIRIAFVSQDFLRPSTPLFLPRLATSEALSVSPREQRGHIIARVYEIYGQDMLGTDKCRQLADIGSERVHLKTIVKGERSCFL